MLNTSCQATFFRKLRLVRAQTVQQAEMTSTRSMSRPIVSLLSNQLANSTVLGRSSTGDFLRVAAGQVETRPRRCYATAQDRQAELQAKQVKLAEKAGRMKHNLGVVSIRVGSNLGRSISR